MHRLEPALRMASIMRIAMLARLGRIDDACRVVEEAVAENSEDAFALLATVFRHALLGEREPLLEKIASYVRPTLWDDAETPEWAAGWLALVGEKEQALDWLEHWIDRGAINYPMLAQGDPLLEPLRGEPRFQRLLDRIRPEWERFVPRF
jgi:alkanesulfonate monooxygenase SsuD/methylene tetrahydromethanopterin reductase-like flavin-dependent oxidoreductase (luciferase family)